MSQAQTPDGIQALIDRANLSLRARRVVEILLEEGSVTTQELQERHGYEHPPRAIADVRDAGIPLVKQMVTVNGRRMAQYRFDDPSNTSGGRLGGRQALPLAFRREVYEAHDGKCAVCSSDYEFRYIQTDHRIPYRISGDDHAAEPTVNDFMPLCPSDNRAKSWTCEHCPNWERREASICATCFWASPEDYDHIASDPERRVAVVWRGKQVEEYERLAEDAAAEGTSVAGLIRERAGGYDSASQRD